MSLYLGNNLVSGVATPIQGARNIGQIIQSTIPLTDAGLHLLDGSLISGSGSYADFVTYIAGLVSTYPDLFDTEANWQSSVSTYGVCGKFVYDSVNGTVRLPKITGFTEGTIDPTTLGDLTEAGLPNITGQVSGGQIMRGDVSYSFSGAFYGTSGINKRPTGENGATLAINLDASRSSSIYGNSSTVQPQSIKVLYYICIATSVKTQIEVDIDEIATDLNGKADVDLINVNNSGTATGAGWAMPSDVYDDLTLGANGATYTAPADGWFYALFNSSTNLSMFNLDENSADILSVGGGYNSGNHNIYIPVKKGTITKLFYNGTKVYFRFIYAKGSEWEKE